MQTESKMQTRSTTIEGQTFNLTDEEIVDLYTKDAPEEYVINALWDFLDDAVDGERLMDFDLDQWRKDNRRLYVVMQYLPANDEERKIIEREGYNTLRQRSEEIEAHGHFSKDEELIDDPLNGMYDPVFSDEDGDITNLKDANKLAAKMVAEGKIGVWIDVFKPSGDNWVMDYIIYTYKGEVS